MEINIQIYRNKHLYDTSRPNIDSSSFLSPGTDFTEEFNCIYGSRTNIMVEELCGYKNISSQGLKLHSRHYLINCSLKSFSLIFIFFWTNKFTIVCIWRKELASVRIWDLKHLKNCDVISQLTRGYWTGFKKCKVA